MAPIEEEIKIEATRGRASLVRMHERQVSRGALVAWAAILGLALSAGAQKTQQGQAESSSLSLLSSSSSDNGEQHPAPEPYSFSFSSDSIGGMTTREETGDANGRVTGFYMMLGEDGRERRVDYVADENGYRASISTNEIGTRSESSAHAEYNARLPSEQQLAQAKISAEDYKFLEETHQAERERHLSQVSQNTQIQQQQQQKQLRSTTNGNLGLQRQQQQQLGAQSRWSGSGFAGQGSSSASNQASITGQANLAEAPISSGRQQSTTDAPQLLPTSTEPKPIWDENAEWRSRQFSSNTDNKSSASQSSAAPTPAGQLQSASWAQSSQMGPISQQQQQQFARTQTANRARSGPMPILQRQIEQQFMIQANALTNQDYPRQQLLSNLRPASNEFNQFGQQQQSNIIEELNNQTDQAIEVQEEQQPLQPMQPLVVAPSAEPQQTTTTTTTTTTTPQPAPNGFLSINLQENTLAQKEEKVAVKQQQEQQVDRRPQEQILIRPQFVQEISDTKSNNEQQIVEVRNTQRPNSIKQVIQNIERPVQRQQEVQFGNQEIQRQPGKTPITTTQVSYPQVSSSPAPVKEVVQVTSTTTTTTSTTTAAPVFVEEATREPVSTDAPIAAATTTTSTTTLRPIQQRVTTPRAVVVSYEPTESSYVPPSRSSIKVQPIGQRLNSYEDLRKNYTKFGGYQSTQSGVKSAALGRLELSRNEQPVAEPRPKVVVSSQQTVGYSTVKKEYINQQQQQPVTTLRPVVQVLNNQQASWKGTKGGSGGRGARKQFWQQQQQQQQQSQPTGVDYAATASFGSRITG